MRFTLIPVVLLLTSVAPSRRICETHERQRGLEGQRRRLMRAQAVNGALTHAVKLAWNRRRPGGFTRSFPSGHPSASVAIATVLQRHLGWRAGVPAYIVAGCVGMSRVTENKRYPSGVIVGAALGFVADRSITIRRSRGRLNVTPLAVPSSAGIGFTVVQ